MKLGRSLDTIFKKIAREKVGTPFDIYYDFVSKFWVFCKKKQSGPFFFFFCILLFTVYRRTQTAPGLR